MQLSTKSLEKTKREKEIKEAKLLQLFPSFKLLAKRRVDRAVSYPLAKRWLGSAQVSSILTLSANGRIAPMVEQRFEEPPVQVRILLRPQLRVLCNGSIAVSKTVDTDSSPVTRAN